MKKSTFFNGLRNIWVLVFGFLCSATSVAQEIGHGNIPDSLLRLSYKELRDIYYPLMEGTDTINTTFFINAHIKKAKLEKDTIEQAVGYYNIAFSMNYENELKYSDSIISITKDKKDYKYPSYGYLRKGMIQFNRGNVVESLDNLLLALKNVDTTNLDLVWRIKSGISGLKNRAGQHQEALSINLEILKSIQSQKDYKSKFYDNYTIALLKLSWDNLYLNKYKIAEEYIDKVIFESINMGDSLDYCQYSSTLAEIKYRGKNYLEAIEIFSACIPKIEDYSLANAYTFRGKSFWDIGRKNEAILDFEKADSVLWANHDFSPEILEVYATLNKHYGAEGATEKQLAYVDKLIYVDSVLDADALYLSKEIKDQYDIPLLLAERQEIIKALEDKNTSYSKWVYALAIALCVSLVFGIYYYRKRLGYKKKYDALMTSTPEKHTSSKSAKIDSEDLGIAEAVVGQVLEGLAAFEAKKGYLEPGTSLQEVAKELDTNSRYLSKIINVYRQKNFSTYINDLRVAYVLEELKTNTHLRKYTIKALAGEIGFGHPESFTKAFKTKTGIYPSYYIKRLNKESS